MLSTPVLIISFFRKPIVLRKQMVQMTVYSCLIEFTLLPCSFCEQHTAAAAHCFLKILILSAHQWKNVSLCDRIFRARPLEERQWASLPSLQLPKVSHVTLWEKWKMWLLHPDPLIKTSSYLWQTISSGKGPLLTLEDCAALAEE